jgi:hypothetical protein
MSVRASRTARSSGWRLRPVPAFVLAFGLACVVFAPSQRAEAAGGDFVVDDASITPTNTCQVESWAGFASNRDFVGVVAPACTVMMFIPVELTAQTQRAGALGQWGSLVTWQAKVNLLPVETGKVGLALTGATIYDFTANENVGSYVNVPATFAILEQFRINVNVGWLYSRTLDLHWMTWGASFEWDIVKGVSLLGEVFGQVGGRPIDQPGILDPRMQVGLRFTPIDPIDVDVIYGYKVTGVNAQWITVGLTYRYKP